MAEINRAALKLTYNGKDISADISKHVESFSYTDHEGGKADDLQVRLNDSKGLWKNAWLPQKGAILTASIRTEYGSKISYLRCGTFAVDEIRAGGPPDTVTLKAVSSMTARDLKKETKSRAWENILFSGICEEMANKHDLGIFYDVAEQIGFKRVDQREESDLAFLNRLSSDNGLSLKTSGEKVIVFDGKKMEAAAPVFSIVRGTAAVGTYDFTSKTHDIFKACEVTYLDPDKKDVATYTFTPDLVPPVGQVLKINQRVESIADAQRIAPKKLRARNRNEIKANFDLMGKTIYLSGLTGTVSGWGYFDGKYIIEEAAHSQDRTSGYRTRVKMRKVLDY